MLASRIAALALAAGTLTLAAGPAFASTEVNPNPARPGASVTVNDGYGSLLCPSTDKTATATSAGFSGGSIAMTRGTQALVGTGRATSRPGSYPVTITCASGKKSSGTYTLVVRARGGAGTGDGAAMLGSGSGTGEATGIALLGAALGVGALALRRKANSHC